uniref:C-type lectin domain-containing protein n=1 Tax=Acrobeloides nanus TaxID=290746 RepID=A0A914END5_9BILA
MKLLLVLVFLISLNPSSLVTAFDTTPATTSVPCSANSTGFNNVCYRAVNTSANWTNAAIDCINQGGNLVSVSSDSVNSFLVNLTEQQFGTSTRFWIGGSSSISDNSSWAWIDGNNMNYTNWAIGRPRNISAYDSLEMHTPSGKWYDTPGEAILPYVCEVPPAGATNPCYDNWSYYAPANKCYRVITKKNTFKNQQSNCYSFGGDLVSIHSSGENFFVGAIATKALNYTSQEVFIGLRFNDFDNWIWVDGTSLNWVPNNFTDVDYSGYSGLLETWPTKSKFLWDYDYTSSIHPAICESDPSFMKKEKK